MNIPDVIKQLITAQNKLDAAAYAHCFSADATVLDEGKTYHGVIEIEQWISAANDKYKTQMVPLDFVHLDGKDVLTTEISGTFDGSPVILSYNFVIEQGLIQTLKVTG
ncbi:nuclear transport factor 2 family protein [Mucilaginibacter sp. CAU 1740]|uniref:nuclear transport factor 2 family protein n=1 Tax=Mucilaginibacter sp. CAU 1740 TaxID=3140365 RepID=UPI00325B7B59